MSGIEDRDDFGPVERDAALAAEFVLRLLDPAEEAACGARELVDPAFAAEVARWRDDFEGLDAAYPPVAPPAGLRGRVEERLYGRAAETPSALARLWESVALWRGLAAGAAAVAVWFALAPPRAPDAEQLAELIAAMAPREGGGEFVASYDPETGTISVTRLVGDADPGRVLQLWALVDAAPVSLGLLTEDPRGEIVLPPDLAERIGDGTLVEVSEEPEGGSPTGRPTGTILAAGFLRDV